MGHEALSLLRRIEREAILLLMPSLHPKVGELDTDWWKNSSGSCLEFRISYISGLYMEATAIILRSILRLSEGTG
jgi:hypothetical protein